MTTSLTSRQTQILKAIVDEYIATASAVGSASLDKKYNLGVSPATIRAEMVELTKMKYLSQPHTSAGRVPTPMAMKFYINQLMEEKQLGVAEEVRTKEDVWDARSDFDTLMNEATQVLADKTHSLAIAATEDGEVWKAGMKNIFDDPEFSDILVCQNLFSMLEEVDSLHDLLFERITGLNPVEVLFGAELSWPTLNDLGVVATRFTIKGRQGAIGIVGPFRRTPSVIPNVRYIGTLIQELLK
jgi:heat-inducible transcriptional repressor